MSESGPYKGGFPALTQTAYVLILVAVVSTAFAYSIRRNGIFSCQATGYGLDRYLAYCQATSYSDYDHGAFWFDLEPAANDAARNAQVLFIGNSRMQFGLSTESISRWFASLPATHYLLGFSYNGNYAFEGPLLQKLRPQARVYVVNVDLFFEPAASPYARTVMRDRDANARYQQKRQWQRVHRAACETFPALCGNELAFFRSRPTGTWLMTGPPVVTVPVSYDERVDSKTLAIYTALGNEFLKSVDVHRDCVILTMVPTVNVGTSTVSTPIGTVRAVARALELSLIAPEPRGLQTFDGSHLDHDSADRWSRAFIEAAGPRIEKCLAASRQRASS